MLSAAVLQSYWLELWHSVAYLRARSDAVTFSSFVRKSCVSYGDKNISRHELEQTLYAVVLSICVNEDGGETILCRNFDHLPSFRLFAFKVGCMDSHELFLSGERNNV